VRPPWQARFPLTWYWPLAYCSALVSSPGGGGVRRMRPDGRPQTAAYRSRRGGDLAMAETLRSEVVTAVIQHQVKAGAEVPYEAWLREISLAAERAQGISG